MEIVKKDVDKDDSIVTLKTDPDYIIDLD